jgi:hypothetical protein
LLLFPCPTSKTWHRWDWMDTKTRQIVGLRICLMELGSYIHVEKIKKLFYWLHKTSRTITPNQMTTKMMIPYPSATSMMSSLACQYMPLVICSWSYS